MGANPVFYFEIPVTDLNRAEAFYRALFGATLERAEVDGHPMSLFAYEDGAPGASGALVTGNSYVPSLDGTRVYFRVRDIDLTLAKAVTLGSEVLYPRTSIGELGFVAEIRDSEGNRIALHMPA